MAPSACIRNLLHSLHVCSLLLLFNLKYFFVFCLSAVIRIGLEEKINKRNCSHRLVYLVLLVRDILHSQGKDTSKNRIEIITYSKLLLLVREEIEEEEGREREGKERGGFQGHGS